MFDGAVLVACGLGDPRACEKHRLSRVVGLVVEYPRHRPRVTKSANDLITLAWGAARWVGRYETLRPEIEILQPTPEKWKGGVPKEIHHPRVYLALSAVEKKLAAPFLYADMAWRLPDYDRPAYVPGIRGKSVPESKRHNVLDAVGLGLWAAGRGV